jgi:hypothetical protein
LHYPPPASSFSSLPHLTSPPHPHPHPLPHSSPLPSLLTPHRSCSVFSSNPSRRQGS